MNENITAQYLDNNEGEANATQYSNRKLDPKEVKFVINETVIRQTVRTPLDIQKWRNAHIIADNRYYPNRSWLYDLYDDCRTDLHYQGLVQKRWDTVLNKPLAAMRDGKPDKDFMNLILSPKFRLVKQTILEAQEWGISGIEFEPGKEFAPRIIARKHIKPKWQIIAFEQNSNSGIDYTSAANIMVIGEPEDLGFMLGCVPYIIYKRNTFGDWVQYIEIFGQPIRVMYYDATDQQAKIELKKTLDESGGSLALMIPKGVEFDVKDGKVTNGDGKLQESLVNMVNQELSVRILSNTETTTNGKTGSQAKSKVHKDQQDEIHKSDLFYLESYLNSPQFLNILRSYGYNTDGIRFEHSQEISIEYLSEYIKILTQLPEDLPIDDDFWYSTFGVPKPANYDAMKKELVEKQKAQKALDTIAADPKNKPSKEVKALNKILTLLKSEIGDDGTSPFRDGVESDRLQSIITALEALLPEELEETPQKNEVKNKGPKPASTPHTPLRRGAGGMSPKTSLLRRLISFFDPARRGI